MSTDSGKRVAAAPRPDFSLPKVIDIAMRPTVFHARPLRNFASSMPDSQDAVEFIVKTDSPIPARALGPALYIADVPVTEMSEIGDRTYRFVALTGREMALDAEIFLGWTGQPPGTRVPTGFRYRL
jgi:hypothetical protein